MSEIEDIKDMKNGVNEAIDKHYTEFTQKQKRDNIIIRNISQTWCDYDNICAKYGQNSVMHKDLSKIGIHDKTIRGLIGHEFTIVGIKRFGIDECGQILFTCIMGNKNNIKTVLCNDYNLTNYIDTLQNTDKLPMRVKLMKSNDKYVMRGV